MITYGSVCSGIEAASVAWEPLGFGPKFFSEIEAFPSAVLAHHWGSNLPGEPLPPEQEAWSAEGATGNAKRRVPNHGDFTRIGADAGPIDLLVGGTPCQSFSVAGKRLGLDDPRGNLALEYLALARRLRARWIVWENVPGVFSSASDESESLRDLRPKIADRTAGDEWNEESDFATFLSYVRECGYGFAYRVLDAQYVRSDGFPHAVPQRRRRVFLVGYLGDWRRAAAVLLEPEGLRGDPAPRRKAGQEIAADFASSLTASGWGVDRAGETRGQDPVIAVPDASLCLNGGGMGRHDAASETLIQTQTHGGVFDVAHSLRGEGFDASEDGTGRGTPWVAASLTRGAESAGKGGYAGRWQEDDVNLVVEPFTLAVRGRDGGHDLEFHQDGVANTIQSACGGRGGTGVGAVAIKVGVRRLMPVECARLQGFPDNHARIPWKSKPAETCPDGPQYKAYGNSMAVNVMRWIGTRIDMMERLIREGRV